MAHYMLRWQFSQAAINALVIKPRDRKAPAASLIAGFGGKLLSSYMSFGEYDGLGVVEFPDHVSVAACSMKAASTGAFTRFETTTLLTTAEAERAMQQSRAPTA